MTTFRIFPNLLKDILHIQSEGRDHPVRMRIINQFGQQVWSEQQMLSAHMEVSLGHLPSGVYQLIIEENARIIFQEQLIKVR